MVLKRDSFLYRAARAIRSYKSRVLFQRVHCLVGFGPNTRVIHDCGRIRYQIVGLISMGIQKCILMVLIFTLFFLSLHSIFRYQLCTKSICGPLPFIAFDP